MFLLSHLIQGFSRPCYQRCVLNFRVSSQEDTVWIHGMEHRAMQHSSTQFNKSCIFSQIINTCPSGVATVNRLVVSSNSTITF